MDSLKPLNILIIEDDPDARANLRDILEIDAHRIEMAGSSAEAFRRDDWSTISAILLDRKLPDATAEELLPRLKAIAPDAAVIVVTGYSDLQGAISALRQGATDYILKPIDADDLRLRLRQVAIYQSTRSALHLAERRFRLLVQNSSDIITAFDTAGTVLYQNPAIERMLGYSSESLLGKNVFLGELLHPDDVSVLRSCVVHAQERPGLPIVAEFRMRHSDGSWRDLEALVQDLRHEPGINAIIASSRDVTERKRAEEANRASEERFRRLFDSGIVGVGVSDRSGLWREANDELLRILGRSRSDLESGRVRWLEATPEQDLPLGRAGLLDADHHGVCAPYEKEYRLADGSTVPVLIGYASLETSDNLFICVVLDMTVAKQTENLLRLERDFARGLIEGAPAIVLVLDAQDRIVRFNRFAEDLSGYRTEEVLGRDYFETLVPERDRAAVRNLFHQTPTEPEPGGTINPLLTRDGREREVRWSRRLLSDDDGRVVGVLALGQDVTDLKEAQERAMRSERLAAIGQMVTGLAHESRNALQRCQACLEMLALHVDDRPEALGLIQRLQRAQDDLHHLYVDVRSYAAPIRLERESCDLETIWQRSWAHLDPQRQGRIASLVAFVGPFDSRCEADPFRLGQVFSNLFENSLAACRDPVRIQVDCATDRIDGKPAVSLTISDNGPGLGPVGLHRVFEPFYTTKTKGTGLGMAISQRIVEAHGGTISLGDHSGPGAKFIITLPRGTP